MENAEVRPQTAISRTLLSAPINSSVSPSLKCSFALSPVVFTIGMTAMLGIRRVSAATSRDTTASKTDNTSSTLCGRSSGSFARQRMTSDASDARPAGRRVVSGGGASVRCAIIIARGLRSVNGARPISISYASTPSAYTSAR